MSKTECICRICVWAIVVAGMVSCSVLAPQKEDTSVACIKAGGDWKWPSCQARPTP